MKFTTIKTLKGNVLTFDELVAMNGYDIAHSDDKRDYFLTYEGDGYGFNYWKVQTIRVCDNGELRVSASNIKRTYRAVLLHARRQPRQSDRLFSVEASD